MEPKRPHKFGYPPSDDSSSDSSSSGDESRDDDPGPWHPERNPDGYETRTRAQIHAAHPARARAKERRYEKRMTTAINRVERRMRVADRYMTALRAGLPFPQARIDLWDLDEERDFLILEFCAAGDLESLITRYVRDTHIYFDLPETRASCNGTNKLN